ncbi:MAG: protein nirD [endosymbiont of Escarpia spicata]|uniref:Protein nirD n=1 Tax=endosymbiont of Escarpia spicata TaxID=2200908 RepID=A0A370DKK8_9GAMM|nr:protein nirD [gamma proteobacterium endosymbiont of Lamellibrachia anaximandri]MBL3616268.1 protein nirD [gamma proteobacterium endosymbiont of Lamellibrachia anaximandri]RDH85438.1 MAG: protein nirD [endosymbiont of Escarpia spicata]
MGEVNCLYCGKKIAEDIAECPHCGAVSHFQKKGYRAGARKKFVLLFIALTIFCLFFIFWLPR